MLYNNFITGPYETLSSLVCLVHLVGIKQQKTKNI